MICQEAWYYAKARTCMAVCDALPCEAQRDKLIPQPSQNWESARPTSLSWGSPVIDHVLQVLYRYSIAILYQVQPSISLRRKTRGKHGDQKNIISSAVSSSVRYCPCGLFPLRSAQHQKSVMPGHIHLSIIGELD